MEVVLSDTFTLVLAWVLVGVLALALASRVVISAIWLTSVVVSAGSLSKHLVDGCGMRNGGWKRIWEKTRTWAQRRA
ncbi:hypothetical protein EDB80DRAFT_721396 [Ilyonectria destructans]|nr:hypothetical protein EDB80DRAFT_721396 [Ilyonectria destructans]